MFTRTAKALLPVLLLVACPAISAADDAGALVQNVEKAMGGTMPRTLQLTASGTGYAEAAGGASHSFWIKTYTYQADLETLTGSERVVRANGPAEGTGHVETHDLSTSAPWPDQVALWTSPYAFLTGAGKFQATVTSETLFGAKYQVVAFTAPNGQPVRGYVTPANLLERIRTAYNDPARGLVQVETIFEDWGDFKGTKFPQMIIRHENNDLARVLIVRDVSATKAPPSHS